MGSYLCHWVPELFITVVIPTIHIIYNGINALLGHSYYWRVLFLFRLKEFIYSLFMYFILYVLGELNN